MPTVQVTPEELMSLADQVRRGNIKTLRIRKRLSGKNKGIPYADYSLKPVVKLPKQSMVDQLWSWRNPKPVDPEEQKVIHYRQRIASIMEEAAKAILSGASVNFEIAKVEDPEVERYTYTLEVK
ncbi:hypothetical protein D3C76_1283290 [compost metagenome]